ncbi:MAG: hypothetical protein ABIK37_00680 [candidate division WOR-3 bacterium]
MRYAVLLLGALTLAIAQPEFSGHIVKPDTARFSIYTKSDPEIWKFDIPSDAYFWMKIDDENGRELADVRLQTSRYVKLVGGGKFSFRLYTVGGDGAWSAKRISGSGSEPHIVSKSAVEEGERSGYLDEGESETFTVIAESDPEEWEFNWIGDGTFWVKVRNRDGVEIADLDLSEGNTIVLKGGGLFTLEIRAVEGGGFWSAERQ